MDAHILDIETYRITNDLCSHLFALTLGSLVSLRDEYRD